MNSGTSDTWQKVRGVIVRGHGVASGVSGDVRFPGGTIRMQAPYFRALGLEIEGFHPGTLNISIAPRRYRVGQARYTFRKVQWHPTAAAEDFSFFDCRVRRGEAPPVAGLIYYPHPETKPEHFQQPDVLELLLPWLDGIHYGEAIELEVPTRQIIIESD
jgi:hypothetical protein